RRDNVEEAVALDEPENLYERSVANFVAAVEGRGAPSAGGEDGVRSLAVALAAREAAASGRRVSVSYG
ncbi:MAG TPA: Gfo/Idh/MocA family oxidoreductase, partial [Thermomicrobiales bacterium]|nr:Gfo/Idh/MocA family oxidoreductase [Thermomicrobiales bacterium]